MTYKVASLIKINKHLGIALSELSKTQPYIGLVPNLK
jgi:hypothetical protein